MSDTLSIPDSASLLDGTPSTAISPLESAALAAVETAWQDAARLAGLVKSYTRAGTAAKALAGLRLRALREHFAPKGGRPKKTSRNLEVSTWSSLLADRVGITLETARIWIQMADAVEAMAESQGLDLRDLCEKLPWDWSAEEAAAVDATVHKLTEDKTQRELLQSDFLATLGYVAPERPNTSNNPTGKNGGKQPPPANPQALLEERRTNARIAFLGTDKPGRMEHGSVALFMTRFVNEAGRELEAMPQAELRDLYEHTVKPFAAVFRKLAGFS